MSRDEWQYDYSRKPVPPQGDEYTGALANPNHEPGADGRTHS